MSVSTGLTDGPQVSQIQITWPNRFPVADDQGVMDYVFELSDVPWPTITVEQIRFCFRTQPDIGSESLRIVPQKILGYGKEVTATLAKGRNPECRHIEPEI